jgi:HSP20 family protein
MFRQLAPHGRLLEPFDLLENDFESLADRFFGPEARRFRGMRPIVPKIDLGETDAQFEVKAELPGVKPEDVRVEVMDGELSIRGEAKREEEQEGKTWRRIEREHGEFERRIALPTAVDRERVEARFADGVLTVTLPKTAQALSRQIKVQTG